jgi:hypothetical protein
MSPLRLTGSTSGYSQLDAPAIAGDQTFTLPGTGGTLDRLNRAGNILQVVSATYGTQVSSSNNTYIDVGLSASITPTSATSKILVTVHLAGVYKATNVTGLQSRILRGATSIIEFESAAGINGSGATNSVGSVSTCYLDSPATTSSTTYKAQFCSSNNLAIVYVNVGNVITPVSTITLMEVAA